MNEKIKIYTKTGDDGTTGLVGGSRVKKYDARLEAYGTVDELNALIGVIRAYKVADDVEHLLVEIQNKLFNIGSVLASDEKGAAFTENLKIKNSDIKILENAIDAFQSELPALTNFVLPAGNMEAAQCHVARTVCRRAERRILEFAEENNVQPEIIKYINRLSDLIFVLARKLANDAGFKESFWKH